MQKVSLLPPNSTQQSSLGKGPKTTEGAPKRIKVTSSGTGKTLKRATSEARTLERKSRIRLETKSSIIRKPIASKTDNRLKRNLDSNQKNKAAEKSLEKVKSTSPKKEGAAVKKASSKKEVPSKHEGVKRSSNKVERVVPMKEKSSADSEFKKKFDSIVQKTVNETKAPTLYVQKPKISIDRTSRPSIFNTKSIEKPTLQIETWGPAQAPKPLFNLSKALLRTNVMERKSVHEKIFPNPENVMKRVSKQVANERALEKANTSKIWKF